jgi:hypothetical protein
MDYIDARRPSAMIEDEEPIVGGGPSKSIAQQEYECAVWEAFNSGRPQVQAYTGVFIS